MNRNLLNLLLICYLAFNIPVLSDAAPVNSGCSVAGNAAASLDSVCPGNPSNLILTGYLGMIQWQSYDGSSWINETGTGSTTDNYQVSPLVTTDYRAVVTELGCPADTSNIVTITAGLSAPTTTGDTRCGYGSVTLTASGNASTFRWYDVPSGGVALGTGASFTTNVSATTTFYAAAASNGGGSATMPMPATGSVFNLYARGYFFTAPTDFTITGLYVPDPANGSTQNIAILRFTGATPPPAYPTVTNAFTTLFITQNDPTVGVISVNIPITAGDVIGVLATRGVDANSYAPGPYVTVIDGQNVTVDRMGMQFELSNTLPMDIWSEPGGSISRLDITYEVGCESGRTPAVATVTPAASISISANPPALCQGQSAAISVSSSNPNYNYTWSPATGLSGTTGTSNTATPATPTTYTIVGDDGSCGAIDSIFIDVGPASQAGIASISSDTICFGTDAILLLTGSVGNVQWQGNDGSGWMNETGPGANTPSYTVSPPNNIQYRAVVTSGGCDPDTTITLDLAVIVLVDPTTVNDTICGPGVATLSASGPGILNWYDSPAGGNSLNTGPIYSPNITTTTTYYVQATAGGTIPVGPIDPGIGNQTAVAGNDYGLQFDVIQQCILQKVYVSPGQTSGSVTINLRDMQGGPILNSATFTVSAFSGLIPLNVNFTLTPGTGYRLELAAGSVECYYNTSGSAYPYTSTGSPVTITSALSPGPNTGGSYYFFYFWQVNVGCQSNPIPVTGVVTAPPPVPTIMQNGTILTSSAPTGNQWYLDGNLIPGATGTTYDMALTGAGSYTVTVTIDGCASTSQPFLYVSTGAELSAAGISIFPNPVKDVLQISFTHPLTSAVKLNIYDAAGRLLYTEMLHENQHELQWQWPQGSYVIEAVTHSGLFFDRVVKL